MQRGGGGGDYRSEYGGGGGSERSRGEYGGGGAADRSRGENGGGGTAERRDYEYGGGESRNGGGRGAVVSARAARASEAINQVRYSTCPAVLRIHEILVRTRIRGLVLWLMDPDPDPAIFVSDLQDVNKKYFFPPIFWYIYIIFQR